MTTPDDTAPEPGPPSDPEVRSFLVLAIAAGFTAWELGFDLGAFETIDHRRFWAIWTLSTIALVGSFLFRSSDLAHVGRWHVVLAAPTIWLIADFLLGDSADVVMWTLTVLTVLALPFALYFVARMLAGDFFALSHRPQVALVLLTIAIFVVGLYIGSEHDRFLTCDDFARAGDYVPSDCAE